MARARNSNLQGCAELSPRRRREWLSALVCGCLIAIVCCCFFSKTVIGGKPITKLFSLSQMDSLFHPEVKSIRVVASIDPSIYFFRLPMSLGVERSWKEGVIPLWNPLNGCGHPMMAMIETGAFNWYVMAFPFSSEYFYNLGIVVRDFIAALGTFFLARSLGIAPLYSTFAALLLCFCPYIIRELELAKDTYLYPGIFAVFVYAARARSLGWGTILAITCGAICATMHPECSLNLVFFASLFVVLERFCAELEDKKGVGEALRGAFSLAGWLAVVGLFAFGIAAPVLLPFLEFVRNAECYKFDYGAPPRVPLQSFLFTLTHPTCRGLSPFLGILGLPLIATACLSLKRRHIPLLICTILAVALFTLFGPLLEIFAHKPWNLLEPIYLQPLTMCFLAVWMALGLESLVSSHSRRKVLFFSLITAVVVFIPFWADRNGWSFSGWVWDGGEWHYEISRPAWRRDLILALAGVIGSAILLRSRLREILPLFLMVLVFVSEWTVARQAMPVHSGFMPVETAAVSWLKEHPGRFMPVGNHLMLPNMNMCWGLSCFRHSNTLFVPRFLEFEEKCGGERGMINGINFDDAISHLIDIAAVRYILADSAIFTPADLVYFKERQSAPVAEFGKEVALATTSLEYDAERKQALCGLHFKTDKAAEYLYQFVVYDDQGREAWISPEYRLEAGRKSQERKAERFVLGRWAVPDKFTPQTGLGLAVRLTSYWSGGPVFPSRVVKGQIRNNVILQDGQLKDLPPFGMRSKFRLCREFPDGIRVYENTQALPEAFCIGASRKAENLEQARKILLSNIFDPRREVLLEGDYAEIGDDALLCPIELKRINGNLLELAVESDKPTFLVVGDSFFPGWKATVNGREQPILRANFLFRGVRLDPGKNLVRFSYEPPSFRWGVVMFSISLGLLILLNLCSRVSRRGNHRA